MLSDYAATPARVEQVGDGGCDDLAAFADRRPLLQCQEAREPREAVAEALETAPAVQEATESPEPARGVAHL